MRKAHIILILLLVMSCCGCKTCELTRQPDSRDSTDLPHFPKGQFEDGEPADISNRISYEADVESYQIISGITSGDKEAKTRNIQINLRLPRYQEPFRDVFLKFHDQSTSGHEADRKHKKLMIYMGLDRAADHIAMLSAGERVKVVVYQEVRDNKDFYHLKFRVAGQAGNVLAP